MSQWTFLYGQVRLALTRETEAWLLIGKRHAEVDLISIAEAGDVALCFGWIDGHRKAYDEVSFLQRYSRRRPKSSWSKVNVARAESLIAAGRILPLLKTYTHESHANALARVVARLTGPRSTREQPEAGDMTR